MYHENVSPLLVDCFASRSGCDSGGTSYSCWPLHWSVDGVVDDDVLEAEGQNFGYLLCKQVALVVLVLA